MGRIQAFFSTPARQALGWTLLGLLGIAMAGGGVWFLTDDGSGGTKTADAENERTSTATASPTATRTASPTSSPTASPTATETATPTATATTRPNTGANTGTGGGQNAPAPTPTPEPTEPPVVAGGTYCPSSDNSFPPTSVFGLFRIGGADVPAGAVVTLAFDGVPGPSSTTTNAGGYRVDFRASTDTCANRVGAAISVIYNGVAYPTGLTVGGAPALRADIVN